MPPAQALPYLDPTRPVAERVADLLQRMTLDEKLAEITTLWDAKAQALDAQGLPQVQRLAERFPHGVGHVARPSDSKGEGGNSAQGGRGPRETAAFVNVFQRHAREHTRLGIPVLFHEEGLHGYAAPGATSFPQAIAQASSWDPELVRACNAVTAREMRARGVVLALTPVLDVARAARWGRVEETFGEDPYLVGELGVAAVQGLQGMPDPSDPGRSLGPDKVFATLKHLTGHAQPEAGINVGPAPVAERELRSFFLPPFEQAIRRAGACVIMPSYNEVDGVPSHVNHWLLDELLRGEWGFEGALVADYFAIEQLHSLHHVAQDLADAARQALAAGVDADLPNGLAFASLKRSVDEGLVPMAQVDRAVARMLSLKFRAGLFEQPFADERRAEALTHPDDAVALALQAAERCVVLLKNEGVLPLALPPAGAPKPRWAVIGPNAAVPRLGVYSGQPPRAVSLLEGLQARVGSAVELRFAQGVRITEGEDWWADEVRLTPPEANAPLIAEAVALAREADCVILAVGDDERTSREAWASQHLGDRARLGLPGQQQALFDALQATGKPVVVVLINGRPVSSEPLVRGAAAILEAWFLGEQGGHALARVLLGDVNPGGKLPLSVARHEGQLPVFYNHKPSARRGYLFDDVSPLFPFGFGLSYTRFAFGAPGLVESRIPAGAAAELWVDLSNQGERAGDEVVQVYVRDLQASVTQPVKALKAFRRVSLAAGEARRLHFRLEPEAFMLWDRRMRRVLEAGEFDILVGPDSQQLQAVRLCIEATPAAAAE